MTSIEKFNPSPILRRAYVQTILASLPARAAAASKWTVRSREIVWTTSVGSRLQGFHTPVQNATAKGLVILLHGWEGSAASTYILTTGRYLHRRGFDIFRLNYRDHGRSHHLNSGIFFATNLREVFDSVKQTAALSNGRPVFIAGFSLGGNFALRIGRQCAVSPIPNLRRVVAVSPVLDPSRATDRIDQAPLFREYFLKKWRRSLRTKQRLFPEKYDFSEALKAKSCREMTRMLLPHQSAFRSPEHYFSHYNLTLDALKDIQPPTCIVTAADDPIIPVDDFHRLKTNHRTELIIHDRGGHNGFINGFFSGTWHERFMEKAFTSDCSG